MRARHPNVHRLALIERRARQMRIHPTLSEARLWEAFRGSALGVGCRRQVVVGGRVVDFAAPAARLAVEVDGPWHRCRPRAEVRRNRQLERAGYQVLHH